MCAPEYSLQAIPYCCLQGLALPWAGVCLESCIGSWAFAYSSSDSCETKSVVPPLSRICRTHDLLLHDAISGKGEHCLSSGACCAAYEWDAKSGQKIYGYTMDSCADPNFWCQADTYHLDVSSSYLDSLGLLGRPWNGRKVSWKYMDGSAPGCAPSQHPRSPWPPQASGNTVFI